MLVERATARESEWLFREGIRRHAPKDDLSRFERYRDRYKKQFGLIGIDHNQNGTLSPANTSFNISVTSTTGNCCILMLVGASTGKATAISDNKNVGYTQVSTGAGTPTAAQIWYFKGATTGVTTITVTCASDTFGWNFYDLSNVDTVSPLDASTLADNQTSSATPTGPSMLTVTANDFVCACIGSAATISAVTQVGVTWVGDFFDSTVSGGGFAHVSPAAVTTYNPVWTNSSNAAWCAISGAFKPASPVTYPPNKFLTLKENMAIQQRVG